MTYKVPFTQEDEKLLDQYKVSGYYEPGFTIWDINLYKDIADNTQGFSICNGNITPIKVKAGKYRADISKEGQNYWTSGLIENFENAYSKFMDSNEPAYKF